MLVEYHLVRPGSSHKQKFEVKLVLQNCAHLFKSRCEDVQLERIRIQKVEIWQQNRVEFFNREVDFKMVWGTLVNKINQLGVPISCINRNEADSVRYFNLYVFAVRYVTLLSVDLLQDYSLWSREYDFISKSVQFH